MPDSDNGRVTLALVSQQVGQIASDISEMRRQGEERARMWQEDHTTLSVLCERVSGISEQLSEVKATRRESRWSDLILALATLIAGALGIKYGAP